MHLNKYKMLSHCSHNHDKTPYTEEHLRRRDKERELILKIFQYDFLIVTLISGLDVRKDNPITMHNDMLKHHFRYHNRLVQNPNRLNIDGLRELFRGWDLE